MQEQRAYAAEHAVTPAYAGPSSLGQDVQRERQLVLLKKVYFEIQCTLAHAAVSMKIAPSSYFQVQLNGVLG